jgi:hypothetical protein
MKKIYLAVPYSVDPNHGYLLANNKAAELMLQGNVVFSPISHSHPIARQCKLPLDHDFWIQQDLPFIEWCDEVCVLQLPCWGKSKGIKAEIEYATKIGKPIKYIEI